MAPPPQQAPACETPSRRNSLSLSSPTTPSDPERIVDTASVRRLSMHDEKPRSTLSRLRSDDDAAASAAAAFPEGGLRAWLCVVGGWWCSFITFGYINTFGVYEDYYLATFLSHKSSSEIAWIGAFQYFLIFGISFVSGRLFDLGFFRPTFTVGCVLLVVCQMLLSLCSEYYQIFLCQGVGLGTSFGIVFNMGINCPAHHFQQRRAMALGIVATGSSTGGVVFPILIRQLIPQIGFAWTMRVVGLIALVSTVAASLCLSTRLQPAIDVADRDKGGWRQVRWMELEAFGNPAYAWFVAGCAAVMFGLYMPFTYMDVFSGLYGVPGSGYYLAVLNAASMFGRALPGMVADRVGRINTLLPHLTVSAALLVVFPLCTNLGGLLAFAIVFGFTSGCYVSLIPACAAQLGTTETVGTRNGMMFLASAVGGLLGTPISGAILGPDPPFHWWSAVGYSVAMVAVGAGCVGLSRFYALGKKWRGRI
ncbi:hypothetical protein ACQY0O_002414 [Thecaphora frezii]